MTEQTITPVPGKEYQVTGSVVFEHDGKTMNGVMFALDGAAFAGHVTRDATGEYVALAWTADDALIEAHPDWAAMIVRELDPINSALSIWNAA